MVFLRTRDWILFTVNTAIHLNIEMISSEFFLATCSSLWIGVKLTIFFKRSFRWREHCFPRLSLDSANLILIIAAQFLVPNVWLLQMITAVIAMVSAITDMYLMMSNLWELVKSLVLGAYIIVSWEIERGSYILPLSSLSFALTQFLRWPKNLKDFLSKVRIVCGPAFPLSVFAIWLKRSEPSGLSFWVLVAVLFSSVAAIFFRPDNSEVWVLFHLPVPSPRSRKVCHAISMVFSLLFLTVHILLYQTFPCIYCKPVCILVVILCVCFFFGANWHCAPRVSLDRSFFSVKPWPWLTITITLQLMSKHFCKNLGKLAGCGDQYRNLLGLLWDLKSP